MIDFCFVCDEKISDIVECIDPLLLKVKYHANIYTCMYIFLVFFPEIL